MTTEVMTVTEAARSFSEMINRVHYKGIPITLTRSKRPVVRIVPEGKRSTGADLLKWLDTRPHMSKAEHERFADELEAGRDALNVPPVSKFDL